MERIPITVQGFERLKAELETLKTVDRKEVVEAIKEARSHGDLSENAEYDAAKEKQGLIEARIKELESKITRFDVINVSDIKADKIQFGATVELENLETDAKITYQIVGPDESDIAKGKISVLSPIARALIGKRKGDDTVVDAPSGKIEYSILDVKYTN